MFWPSDKWFIFSSRAWILAKGKKLFEPVGLRFACGPFEQDDESLQPILGGSSQCGKHFFTYLKSTCTISTPNGNSLPRFWYEWTCLINHYGSESRLVLALSHNYSVLSSSCYSRLHTVAPIHPRLRLYYPAKLKSTPELGNQRVRETWWCVGDVQGHVQASRVTKSHHMQKRQLP